MHNDSSLYWIVFVVTFFAVAIWESYAATRALSCPPERRWAKHGMLLALSIGFEWLVFRITPVLVAVAFADSRSGLLNQEWIPAAAQFAIGLLLLDLSHYGVHRAFHSVSLLWRVHETHHSDPDYDVSTAVRFHPLEIFITQGAMLATIAVLSPPPAAVLTSVLLSTMLNLFTHANASLPRSMDKLLRFVIVTPDMHRIHHSEEVSEQGANFGQTFSWWDRLFGSYLPRAAKGEAFPTGIRGLQDEKSVGLGFMLNEPFRARGDSGAEPALRVDSAGQV